VVKLHAKTAQQDNINLQVVKLHAKNAQQDSINLQVVKLHAKTAQKDQHQIPGVQIAQQHAVVAALIMLREELQRQVRERLGAPLHVHFKRHMNGHLTFMTITTLAGNQGNWA